MQTGRSLIEGSISHRLFFFAMPILLGNVLQSLDVSVNSVWIGRFLGEAALTASSNANVVLFLLLGAMIGLALAATILIGQYLGAHRLHDAKRVVGTSTVFSVAIAVVMAAVGWTMCTPMLDAMKTPPAALPLAVAYMRVIFLSLPFLVLYIFATSVLRGAGDSKTPLYFLILNVVLDIGLNPVLIFGLGPFPRLGIAGSALATLTAQATALIALIAYLYRRRNPLCLHGAELKLLRFDWGIVSTLVTKGVPMGLQMIVVSLSGVLMITLVNRYGINTTAAYGAALQVWNYVQLPAFAIGMAVSSMAAQNIGANKWDRVVATARVGILYQFALTTFLVLVVVGLSRQALGLFLPPHSTALAIAVHLNLIGAWNFIFFAIALVMLAVVRANGAVVPPLIILAFALLGVRFPLALAFMRYIGSDGIWWSFTLSSGVALVLGMIYYKFGRWRELRSMMEHDAAGVAHEHIGAG